MLNELNHLGYTIIDPMVTTNPQTTKEVPKLTKAISPIVVKNKKLEQRLLEIKEEDCITKGLATLKRNASILRDLPVVSNPEFTMTVSQWYAHKHHPKLDIYIVGRQGNYLALKTNFQ